MVYALATGGWGFRGECLVECCPPSRAFALPMTTSQITTDEISQDDTADIAAACGGDDEAYARLVRRHQPAIGTYMWRFTRDRELWKELVHDVFVEAYFSLSRFRGEAPLLHWLRKIATRVGYRYWKRNAKERSDREVNLHELAARVGAKESPSDASSRVEFVHAALAQLPPRDRAVLTLLHLEELSTKEAAEMLGWSHALVRVQAFRARRKLKTILEMLGSENT